LRIKTKNRTENIGGSAFFSKGKAVMGNVQIDAEKGENKKSIYGVHTYNRQRGDSPDAHGIT